MSLTNAPRVVSFDARTAVEAIRATAGESLRVVVEYDDEEFNPLYVDEATLSFYESPSHMRSHFEKIHSYVHVDFTEMELFTDELFPVADRVRYLVTSFDTFTLLRIYVGSEGMFVAIDPTEPAEPVAKAVERVCAGESAEPAP